MYEYLKSYAPYMTLYWYSDVIFNRTMILLLTIQYIKTSGEIMVI